MHSHSNMADASTRLPGLSVLPAVEVKEVTSLGGSVQEDVWVPVCLPEELPKGEQTRGDASGCRAPAAPDGPQHCRHRLARISSPTK